MALFVDRGPVIFMTTLTAAAWAYIAPPAFSLLISSTYDKIMEVTYFVVALTIGHLLARLRASREAEIKTKMLVESERLGRTLLNSVSHELRTPIATIVGGAAGLRDGGGALTDTQQKLAAAEIEHAGARLNRVVQSLLVRVAASIRTAFSPCSIGATAGREPRALQAAKLTAGRLVR